jgi:hypothetical protein
VQIRANPDKHECHFHLITSFTPLWRLSSFCVGQDTFSFVGFSPSAGGVSFSSWMNSMNSVIALSKNKHTQTHLFDLTRSEFNGDKCRTSAGVEGPEKTFLVITVAWPIGCNRQSFGALVTLVLQSLPLRRHGKANGWTLCRKPAHRYWCPQP